MDRILSFESLDNYLEGLSQKNVDINDYCSCSLAELNDKISIGINSPIMCFFNYSWKLDGNQQRTFNTRAISFSILFTGITADNFAAQRKAINDAEAIGFEILSRIHIESKMPETGWLYNNFLKDSVHGEASESEGADGFWGMDFHFDLKVSEPLLVTPDKWSDGQRFCQPQQ